MPAFLTIADNTSTPWDRSAVVITTNTQTPSNLNSYSGGTTVNAGAFLYLTAASRQWALAPDRSASPPSGANRAALSSGLVVDGGVTYANDVTGAGYVHNNSNSAGIDNVVHRQPQHLGHRSISVHAPRRFLTSPAVGPPVS